MALKFSLPIALGLMIGSALIAPMAYAGSGGAFGGNDSGSNLDSTNITGGTFNFTDAIIILNPIADGIVVDRQTNVIEISPSLVPNLETLTEQFIADNSGTGIGALTQNAPGGTEAFVANLETALLVPKESEQAQLLDQLAIALQGLTTNRPIDPNQLDQAIKIYNKLVNALNKEQLTALRDTPEGKELRLSLQQLRGFFETSEAPKQ